MKIDERIILYLDNQLTDEGRNKFETELKNLPFLSNQLEIYKNTLQSLKIDEQKFNDEQYFQDIVLKFRKSQPLQKEKLILKPAYAISILASAIIILFIIFNPFKEPETLSYENVLYSLNEKEAVELLNFYSDESSINASRLNGVTDSLIANLITSEINVQEADVNSLINSNEISVENIYSEIQLEEVEVIYQEILNKKYF